MKWFRIVAWAAAAMAAITVGIGIGGAVRRTSIMDEVKLTVVIDAGHGGIDGGVSGKFTKVKESNLNLSIAQKLADEFSSRGNKVVMTRTRDEGLYGTTGKGHKMRDMEARKKIILNAQADIVISIHLNSFPVETVNGPHVFHAFNNESGRLLASAVQESMNRFKGTNHVAKNGDYFILQCSEAPSIIVECGFLSNREEEVFLSDKANHTAYAKAIFDGVMLYLYSC